MVARDQCNLQGFKCHHPHIFVHPGVSMFSSGAANVAQYIPSKTIPSAGCLHVFFSGFAQLDSFLGEGAGRIKRSWISQMRPGFSHQACPPLSAAQLLASLPAGLLAQRYSAGKIGKVNALQV